MINKLALLLVSSLALSSAAYAEISQAEFEAALTKYVKTEKGQDVLGEAFQGYVQRMQAKAKKNKGQQERADMEKYFKNPVKVPVGNSPSKGPKDAKVTVVEFSDFECPFCVRGNSTMVELLKAYPKDVRLVFKNLPLPFHKNAKPAAAAALAAGKQGKFWEMHDVLFQNTKNLNTELYEGTAKKLGLDLAKFKKDMASKEIADQIEADMKIARDNDISGTPGFFVNGVPVKGAYPIDHFKKLVDRWLKKG